MNDKDLFQKLKNYQELKAELETAEAGYDALCRDAMQKSAARYDALGSNIQRFCGSESFRSVLKNFCYLYSDRLSVRGGNLAYMGSIPSPMAFDRDSAPAIAEKCVSEIKLAVQNIARKSENTDLQIRKLCLYFTTLRSIHANVERFSSEAAQEIIDAEDRRISKLKAQIDVMLRSDRRLDDPEKLKALIAEAEEKARRRLGKFYFEDMVLGTDYGASISIPFALSEGEDPEICEWEPLNDGVLYAELPDGETEAALSFIKSVCMQFMYSYPGTDKQICYCCKKATSVMDKFLSNLGNKKEGLGDAVFFKGVDQIESKAFNNAVAEHFNELRAETKKRLELLDDVGASNIFEYNEKNPKNVQSPILVIMNGYPDGFDECGDLPYLLKEGRYLGIFYLVTGTAYEPVGYSRYDDNIVDLKKFCRRACVLTDSSFTVDGVPHKPVYVRNNVAKELIRTLCAERKESVGDFLSYENIGFGQYDLDADEKISIPVALNGNEICTLDFGCMGTDTIAYLLVGAPGTGKSSLIDAMIMNGAMAYSPDDLNFYLLDFKDGISSAVYKGEDAIPHVKVISEHNKHEDASIILTGLLNEKQRRNDLFKECGSNVHTIADYNRTHTPHMPRIIVVIDECQVLFESAELAKACEDIARQGRSTGIHLLLASQSVSSAMMTHAGKFIDGRFCFEVDGDDAERVIGREYARQIHVEVPKGSGFSFASWDSGVHCDKIRIAWHDKKISEFNRKIREKWEPKGYSVDLTVVGDMSPLYAVDNADMLRSGKGVDIPFGENYFDRSTEHFEFTNSSTRGKKRSAIIFGQNESASNSILASVMTGALRAGATVKLIDESENRDLDTVFNGHPRVSSMRANDGYLELLSETFVEFKRRSDDRRMEYEPFFLIINGLHYVEQFASDTKKPSAAIPQIDENAPRRRVSIRDSAKRADNNEELEISGRRTLIKMLKNLSMVPNMFIIISADENMEFGEFADKNVIKGISYKLLLNTVNESVRNLTDDLFKYKMIEGINENMVLISSDRKYIKARFLQYDLNDRETQMLIREIVKGDRK